MMTKKEHKKYYSAKEVKKRLIADLFRRLAEQELPPGQKSCLICWKIFIQKTKNARCCSVKCQRKLRQIETKEQGR